MKCSKCGAELNDGCIYCSVCGQEAQIVSDTSLIEEELLKELLEEEKRPVPKQSEERKSPKKKKKNMPLLITFLCLSAIIIVGTVLFAVVVSRNHNSFNYQIKKAGQCVEEKNYTKALEHYTRALEIKEDDVTTQFSMVELYITMDDEKSAIALLNKIISKNAQNERAYQMLIDLYVQDNDYDAIQELRKTVEDKKILKLFKDYEVNPPVFSPEPGGYAEYISIEITTEGSEKIYYTTDGSDPVEKGQLYEEPIRIEEQDTFTLKAVSCNERGLYSDVVEGEFTVRLKTPAIPRAVPDSGSFKTPTSIILIGSEGNRMYYTWDGSDPTWDRNGPIGDTMEYNEPIEVPEGDNILTVVQVDKYGIASEILKCNYKYFP